MAMKVLIVDDEERQRSGLIRHIDWNAHRMAITGDAESAEQALAMAAENPPDLMITDIRMLEMDGLTLSRAMRAHNQDLRIIMITGYEEFVYAKAALGLGVDAFLVKPVNFVELEKILDGISLAHHKRLKMQEDETLMRSQLTELLPIARDKFLQELVNGLAGNEENIAMRSRYLGMFGSEGPRVIVIVAMDTDIASSNHEVENRELARLKIRRSACEEFGDRIEETTTDSRGDTVLFLKCPEQDNENSELKNKLNHFHENAEIGVGCKLSMGIGSVVGSLRRLTDSYRLAQRAVSHRLLVGCGQIIDWQDAGEKDLQPGITIDSLNNEILKEMRVGDGEKVAKCFDGIVHELLESDSGNETETRSICFELVIGSYRIAREIGDPVGRYFSSEKKMWKQILDCEGTIQLLQVTRSILAELCEFTSQRKKSHYSLIVQNALAFMRDHFSEDLSLQDVASRVYLSPSYLGALLRSELGQSFTEQLTAMRMNKAKEILKDPQYKMYEVADSVGYKNPAYFANLFRRNVGMSPMEYRDSLGK